MKIIDFIIKSINFVICLLLVLIYIWYIFVYSYAFNFNFFNFNDLEGLFIFLIFTSWITLPSVMWLYLFFSKKNIIQNLLFNLIIFFYNALILAFILIVFL